MGKFIDLTGKRFGKLQVIGISGHKQYNNGRKRILWECICDCGKTKKVIGNDLTANRIKSCGCSKGNGNNKGKNILSKSKKKNTYDLSGEYGIGYTTNGEEFWFDLEDYDKIKDYYWTMNDGYVVAIRKYQYVWMHRLVMGVDSKEKKVDHIKHVKYDNRKTELRIVDVSKNNMNREIRTDNTSGVTGVCWNKKYNKWMAYICTYGKRKTLGYYENKDDAILSRKQAEEKYFGEYSYDKSINKYTFQEKESSV